MSKNRGDTHISENFSLVGIMVGDQTGRDVVFVCRGSNLGSSTFLIYFSASLYWGPPSPSREGSVEVSGEGVGTGKLSKKFIRNSGLIREFAEIPSPVVNLKILVNFQITLGLRPREIWKFPLIFKFPLGIGNLSAYFFLEPKFVYEILVLAWIWSWNSVFLRQFAHKFPLPE